MWGNLERTGNWVKLLHKSVPFYYAGAPLGLEDTVQDLLYILDLVGRTGGL